MQEVTDRGIGACLGDLSGAFPCLLSSSCKVLGPHQNQADLCKVLSSCLALCSAWPPLDAMTTGIRDWEVGWAPCPGKC